MKIENGENGYLIRNKCKITNRFNNFFINAVLNLGIEVDQHYICNNSNILDPVEKAIIKHQKTFQCLYYRKMVSFPSITSDDISKEIKRLDIKEATQECGVLTK